MLIRVLLGALTAAVVLAGAVASAGARRIELSNQTFRALWRGGEAMTFERAPMRVVCEVTLEGSFHSRTLSKVCGQLIGYVTRAMKNGCTGGQVWWLNGLEVQEGVTLPNTLPWHIQYNSFTGTLPTIRTIKLAIVNLSVLVEILGVKCLYRSTQAHPQFMELPIVGGEIQHMEANPAPQIPRKGEEIACPEEIGLSGRAALRVLGTETSTITVRLVQ